jgi:hypothetical protein
MTITFDNVLEGENYPNLKKDVEGNNSVGIACAAYSQQGVCMLFPSDVYEKCKACPISIYTQLTEGR